MRAYLGKISWKSPNCLKGYEQQDTEDQRTTITLIQKKSLLQAYFNQIVKAKEN